MSIERAVGALVELVNAGDTDRLAGLCDSKVELVADGAPFSGVSGVQRWMDARREARFVVREVAGEAGETASAVVGSVDASGAERLELMQIRLDESGRVTYLVVRPVGRPVRTFAMLSAKPGLSRDEFVDYYENHHVPLIRSLAPVPLAYTRSYLPAVGERRFPADFDVVTQMRFADGEAQAEWLALVTAAGSGVAEDEARFLDRSRTRSWGVQVEGDSNPLAIGHGLSTA